ncbi:hypothetical protein H8A99_35155 [Bradyrhizobium sp. Arg68]|uniref:hypothetical protein n=1 Tax=Bradyrhizobium ivorense TaxID=2511166 RepID=UPI001E56D47A|nr:hypothetical protein [Bradyrhizobium ivorense]MCC8941540.1 hypothetical protein [Bradyrhizobium ivorense]
MRSSTSSNDHPLLADIYGLSGVSSAISRDTIDEGFNDGIFEQRVLEQLGARFTNRPSKFRSVHRQPSRRGNPANKDCRSSAAAGRGDVPHNHYPSVMLECTALQRGSPESIPIYINSAYILGREVVGGERHIVTARLVFWPQAIKLSVASWTASIALSGFGKARAKWNIDVHWLSKGYKFGRYVQD